MTKRRGIERLFPAGFLVLLILSVVNLFGDHRFGGGLPIFLLGCAAIGILFLIGASAKLPEDDMVAPDDAEMGNVEGMQEAVPEDEFAVPPLY